MLDAVVAIGDKQWQVSVATTFTELVMGLSGLSVLPAGQGMLFDMHSDQTRIDVNMTEMLFSLDIVFINSELVVVGVLHDAEPGESAAFDAGGGPSARYFMEVNAGELVGVGVGDSVGISGYTPGTPSAGIDLGQVIQAMIALGMVGIMAGFVTESTHHSIHGPERDRLVDQFGTWAVGRAEAVCPADDVSCVEREAAKLYAKIKDKGGFYWGLEDKDTKEVVTSGRAYTTRGRALVGARAYRNKEMAAEHPVGIKIYSSPPPTSWVEDTRVPVYEEEV